MGPDAPRDFEAEVVSRLPLARVGTAEEAVAVAGVAAFLASPMLVRYQQAPVPTDD